MVGLDVRSECMLAPSAFLASAAVMLSLLYAVLVELFCDTDDPASGVVHVVNLAVSDAQHWTKSDIQWACRWLVDYVTT